MPSSKGKPTDPKLREEVKEYVLHAVVVLLVARRITSSRAYRSEKMRQTKTVVEERMEGDGSQSMTLRVRVLDADYGHAKTDVVIMLILVRAIRRQNVQGIRKEGGSYENEAGSKNEAKSGLLNINPSPRKLPRPRKTLTPARKTRRWTTRRKKRTLSKSRRRRKRR
jgi:hypothetical protein